MHDLNQPLAAAVIDSASGIVQPFFDYETKTLYLCGKGEGTIRYYEIVDDAPHIYYLNQFISGQPQKSLGWMPKRGLNVSVCEIFRFYKMHAAGSVVEPISFMVPRKSTLFQADLYPDTLSTKPAMTLNEWFVLGQNKQPNLVTMNTIDDGIIMKRSTTNQTITANNNKLIEQQKQQQKQQTTVKQTTTTTTTQRFTATQPIDDLNIKKKFAFLANETIPDYRTGPQRMTMLKDEKTTTNQSTKFHQLQSLFNGSMPTNGHLDYSTFEENINYVHSENEVGWMLFRYSIFFPLFVSLPKWFVSAAEDEKLLFSVFFLALFYSAQLKKIIQHQHEEIKNLRNQLKTSDKRVRELEFEMKKMRLEHN